jgi:GMP reductase
MRIEEDTKLDYSDVLFRPKRSTLSSRKDVELKRTYKFKYSNHQWSGTPIIAANMDGVGELEVAKNLFKFEIMTCLTKQHDIKTIKRNSIIKDIYPHLALSTGTSDKDYKRLNEILKEFSFFEFICIDIANGYSDHFSKFVRSVREKYPTKTIIAGNVVTADMTQELVMSGADIVKVGIGPGSVCTTRIQTGVGYPQLSAVIECADAAHGLGAHIIADGGCTCPGDVAKAFGGGADFVMLGGMFAGHEEGGGKKIKKNGSQFIEFYGSSSDTALDKHYGGHADYRSSEGKKVQLKYRGKIKDTVLNILGGVRSSCTYVGAPSLKQLSKCTTFIRVNKQYNDTFK